MSDKTMAGVLMLGAGLFAGLASGSFLIGGSVCLGITALLIGIRSIFNKE